MNSIEQALIGAVRVVQTAFAAGQEEAKMSFGPTAKAELLQIHHMIMCAAEVTQDTKAEGYTANAVKQLIIFCNENHK
jgi:hypothetical protein